MFKKEISQRYNNLIPIITLDPANDKSLLKDVDPLIEEFPEDQILPVEVRTSQVEPRPSNLPPISCKSEKNRVSKRVLDDKFTALPHYNVIGSATPIKMVDMTKNSSKTSRFVVALDGYIPNSKVRENYPPIFSSFPQKKKKPKSHLSEEEEFMKRILLKHLAPDKIKEVRTRRKKESERKRPYYTMSAHDVTIVQNEVIDNFNFELEMATSEPSMEKSFKRIPRKQKTKPIGHFMPLKSRSRSSRILSIHEELSQRQPLTSTESTEYVEEDVKIIDVDILDKLEKQIEENERLGGMVNAKINERIMKDRSYRMSEEELLKWLMNLQILYGSKKYMYKEISNALNGNRDSIDIIESYLKSRQKRLEFLNTLTDPQHLFKYLLNFIPNKSELLDTIQDLLIGGDPSSLKQLSIFCGERYKLQEFFNEFVAVKNYAKNILGTKIASEKERLVALEKCLRDGEISENIVFHIFKSSMADAKLFFDLIPECRLKEMVRIIENIKEIQIFEKAISSTVTTDTASTFKLSETKASTRTTSRKEMKIEKPYSVTLPPLPDYNQDSWKMMMSSYIDKMLTSIVPDKTSGSKTLAPYIEDANLIEQIKDLCYLHTEVLRLLNVYLGNDEESAKKLHAGLIAEDELAYQALIELIGEKEALQIIKSLRLKQAKIIEKVIETLGNEEEANQAKMIVRSMMHYLPESLSKNLKGWLDAGQITASDISKAVNELTKRDTSEDQFLSEPQQYESTKLISDDWKRRPSMMAFLTKEEEDVSKGPLRRKSMLHTNIEVEYRDIPERDADNEGVLSFADSTMKDYFDNVSLKDDMSEITTETERQTVRKRITFIQEDNTFKTGEELIEFQFCKEICNTPWFTSEPTTHYEEIVSKIVDLIQETDDVNVTHEMENVVVNIADNVMDEKSKDAVAEKIVEQVFNLLHEDDKEQTEWLNILSNVEGEEKIIEKEDHLVTKTVKVVVDDISKLKNDFVIKSEQYLPLEESIKSSYYKHLRVRRLINLLKTFELKRAEQLERVIKDKIQICNLFLPEYTEHVTVVRHLGIQYFEPYELPATGQDVIMRMNNEEIKRNTIKCNKIEETPLESPLPNIISLFWERASIGSKKKDVANVSEKTSTTKDQLTLGPSKRHSDDYPCTLHAPSVIEDSLSDIDQISDQQLFPVIFERISDASIMSFKEAMTIKSYTMKGEIEQGEYNEQKVIETDRSLDYEICEYRLIEKKKRPLRKPRDPYNDFHTIYGNNSYYLPYIRPEFKKKCQLRKDTLPNYNSAEKPDNVVFQNVKKMIKGFGTSKTKVTPTFTQARFIRRPSDVPLSDWVKIGAPGMASNMVLSNQIYKVDNSKCTYQHFSKLKLHNYGISATKYLERCDMLEFITKANSSTSHDKVKSKLESRIDNGSERTISSMVKSF